MNWQYNKKEPWLSGMGTRPTRRYIKHNPEMPLTPYLGKGGKWVASIAEARVFTDEEVGSSSRWDSPSERWQLISD